jgi:hypothetical protein
MKLKDDFKRCDDCCIKERIKDKKLRDKKKLNSEEYNNKNELVKKCKICGNKESIESFDNRYK